MNKKSVIIFISVLLGILIIFQARSFQSITSAFSRDSSLNIFREVQILKETSKNLKSEIEKLQDTLDKLKDRALALKAIEAEIKKDKLISGNVKVYGPGIKLIVEEIDILWMIDLVNELYSIGAEAISVNDIRLTNQTIGFDLLPNGQILLNGIILNKPYIINVIGDSSSLENTLQQPGGFISRLKSFKPKTEITIEKQKTIGMEEI